MRWFKRLFQKKYQVYKWQMDAIQSEFTDLKEEICILKKIANLKDHKEIGYNYFSFSPKSNEEELENQRKELRKKGYSFCHKKNNGTEIWAKF